MTPACLLGPILRDVSRSFFLSIRLLPSSLREPVGVAYLLARSTDTIADTATVATGIRVEALQQLAAAIDGTGLFAAGENLQRDFLTGQTNEAERQLLQALPATLQMLELLKADDRSDIRRVLAGITRGQALDLERFGKETKSIRSLPSAADLDEYTYLVAGCVGEFWTRVCRRNLANFAGKPEQEMMSLGVQYGKGLQLVNILRDAQADLANGRCYFPTDELSAVGLSPSEISSQPERFAPVYHKWLDTAERGLNAGMQYSVAIGHYRVRAATVLPALIGARTLSLLRAAGPKAFLQKIKVPRNEVRGMIARMAFTFARRRSLLAAFERARA